MSTSTTDCPSTLCLSGEAAWAVHAALVAQVERALAADEHPTDALGLLEQVEAGDGDFDRPDLRLLAEFLETSLSDAPARDRPLLRSVLADVEAAIQSSTPR